MEEFDFHEHPLILVDLELVYEEKQDAFEDEHGDDADNLDIEEEFRCRCHRCGEEINEHHRYYYKCSSDSCDYSIHKFCVKELPPTLNHPSDERHILTHEHPFILVDLELVYEEKEFWCLCDRCDKEINEHHRYYYKCSSDSCDYSIHKFCLNWKGLPPTLKHASHERHILTHEHPLILVDLELVNEEKQDAYEDEHGDDADNLVIEEEFWCICDRCDDEINEHHRYYYKCSSDSCDYSIHKFCVMELPPTLNHPSHEPHILTLLTRSEGRWYCDICEKAHEPQEKSYCCSQCNYDVDLDCALPEEYKRVYYHPSHIHPLVLISEPILCKCHMCGKEHKGTFYRCNTCVGFFIHSDCVALPRKLFIQEYTDGAFSHPHPLTLSYSFPWAEQNAASYPRCRVCDYGFYTQNTLSIYKCEKCWFYTHLDCATSRKEPFMGILTSPGLGKLQKNYKDSDHPDLLHLPFTDETHSILKHKFFRATGSESFGVKEHLLTHMSHPHPLTLVDTKCDDITLSCHNPMKKIELLCNGCLRPITSMPFYKCCKEDESCNFSLHEWCTRLPHQVQNHPGHPEHPLVLLPKAPYDFGVFKCHVCELYCNGFVYSCVDCGYNVDVSCAFIPGETTHQAHPNHLLKRVQSRPKRKWCCSCDGYIPEYGFSFSCVSCDFDLHPGCALLLQQTIRHKFDQHPMKLSYFPIENHKNKYFCEICEEEFDPQCWFYHCNECVQSMHTSCTPFLLECEGANYNPRDQLLSPYKHVNIKFGGLHKIESHPHLLSFVHGTPNDGICTVCLDELRYEMIFKCLECEFAIHVKCCTT